MSFEPSTITIEVVYALAEEQQLITLSVAEGMTARDALRHVVSQSLLVFPDFDEVTVAPDKLPIGVYGQTVPDDYVLKEGDRLELYRPLLQDPMERRRQVAKQNREA